MAGQTANKANTEALAAAGESGAQKAKRQQEVLERDKKKADKEKSDAVADTRETLDIRLSAGEIDANEYLKRMKAVQAREAQAKAAEETKINAMPVPGGIGELLDPAQQQQAPAQDQGAQSDTHQKVADAAKILMAMMRSGG